MNNKITKQRLKTFLIYDGVKAVAITALVLLCVIIIFNYFAKRPSESQTFSVLIDNVEIVSGDGQEEFYKKVSYGTEGKLRYGLSSAILNGNVTTITPSSGSPMESLVQTYITLKDDDVLIAGKTIATYYLNRNAAMKITDFTLLLDNFLYKDHGFYLNENARVEDISEVAVKDYFYKNNAKNYLTKSQKEKGLEQEIERIKGYKTNSDLFKKLLNVCPSLCVTDGPLSSYEYGGVKFEGVYALNLGALGSDFINVYKTKETVDGVEVDTTNGVYLLLGSRLNSDSDAMFETLSFILALAEDYSNVLGG